MTESSIHSGRSAGTHHTNLSALDRQRTRFATHMNDEEGDFALEAFLNSLQLNVYKLLDEEQKAQYLEQFDALDLFNAVNEVTRELAVVKLENHFLMDFLEKNDPKLLIGLKTRREAAEQHRHSALGSNAVSHHSSIRRSLGSKRSVYTMTQSISGSVKKGVSTATTDYRLNYKAKAEMAEKAATDVEKRIMELEKKAMKQIKLLNARIEELQFRCNETEETSKNFQLHFLKDERDLRFLETATEKQLERKFSKFVNNWLKNARALLSTMRLRITALQESCQQQRSDLITKADLSGILGAVDFEQLIIKRTELINSLDEKNAHMAGLKGVTAKASLAMSEEKQIMTAIENESKMIQNKTAEVIRAIGKLEKESAYVEQENKQDMKTLKSLQEQLERFEAPSVDQYIEKKDELLALEKEEKMLQRKIYILHMKLNNLYYKTKRREEEG